MEVWTLVIAISLIPSLVAGQIPTLPSINLSAKSIAEPADYPEGFADKFGKGAILTNAAKVAEPPMNKVESFPETVAPRKDLEDGKDYVTVGGDNEDIIYLSNDYVADPSVIQGEVVSLPNPELYHKGCTIASIDPNSQPSSEAFDVRGILDDCAAECASEVMYQCTAYTFGGPGTYCVLHGELDQGDIYPQNGSEYSITDVNCLNNGSEYSRLQKCQFDVIPGIKITPANIGVPFRHTSVLNRSHCEASLFHFGWATWNDVDLFTLGI